MSKSIEEILGFETMLGIVEDAKDAIPDDILPSEFFTLTKGMEGQVGTYTVTDGSRQAARAGQYGSESKLVEQRNRSARNVTLIHQFEKMDHNPVVLSQLRSFDNPARQAKGEQEIDSQTASFMTRGMNLRKTAVASMLGLANVFFDDDGNVLPTSSGAVTTVPYNVPAGNQDQLDVFGAGDIISASWATSTTDIIGQTHEIRDASTRLSGHRLGMALYGENILNYLASNDAIGNILQSNNNLAESFALDEIPDGFLKFKWRSVSEFFFEDQDGTTQDIFGPDTVVFIPEVSNSWYEMLEGTYPVPTNLGAITESAVQQLDNFEEVQGMFSYNKLIDDPVTVRQFAGDTFLPALKVPRAIFISDVTP